MSNIDNKDNNNKGSVIENILVPKRNSEFWKTFPIQSFDWWMQEYNKANHIHKDKNWFKNVMVDHRTETDDALYELPTLETLNCLFEILNILINNNINTNPVLSVGSGLGLIEKLLIEKCEFYNIICSDNFPKDNYAYTNSNEKARQMNVENLSYTDIVKKYNNSNIILSIWTPYGLNLTKLILEANPNINAFIYIGEPIDGSTGCKEMFEVVGWKLMSVYPKTLSQIDRLPDKVHHTQIDIYYKLSSYPNFTGDIFVDFPKLKKEWMDEKGEYILDINDILDDLTNSDKGCLIQ